METPGIAVEHWETLSAGEQTRDGNRIMHSPSYSSARDILSWCTLVTSFWLGAQLISTILPDGASHILSQAPKCLAGMPSTQGVGSSWRFYRVNGGSEEMDLLRLFFSSLRPTFQRERVVRIFVPAMVTGPRRDGAKSCTAFQLSLVIFFFLDV